MQCAQSMRLGARPFVGTTMVSATKNGSRVVMKATQSWLPGNPIPSQLSSLPASYGFGEQQRRGQGSAQFIPILHPVSNLS